MYLKKEELENLVESINKSENAFGAIYPTANPELMTLTIYNRELLEEFEAGYLLESEAILSQSSIVIF